MNKSNKIIEYSIYSLLAVANLFFWYLFMLFLTLELNPIKWCDGFRLVYEILFIITSIISIAIKKTVSYS